MRREGRSTETRWETGVVMQTRDGSGPTQRIMAEMEEVVELRTYFADRGNRVS